MAKKKIEVDKKIPSELYKVLQQYPNIEKVWVNDFGEWSFHEREGWTEFKSSEVLGQPEVKAEAKPEDQE